MCTINVFSSRQTIINHLILIMRTNIAKLFFEIFPYFFDKENSFFFLICKILDISCKSPTEQSSKSGEGEAGCGKMSELT